MNRDEIMKILPHRDGMLLVDELYKDGDESVSNYTVKGTEFFLQGHFPGMPIVPGVILCEMMGQGASLLLSDILNDSVVPMFAGMENVRFKHVVRPGDTVHTRSKLISMRSNLVFIESKASVDGHFCCSAHLTVALVKKDM